MYNYTRVISGQYAAHLLSSALAPIRHGLEPKAGHMLCLSAIFRSGFSFLDMSMLEALCSEVMLHLQGWFLFPQGDDERKKGGREGGRV